MSKTTTHTQRPARKLRSALLLVFAWVVIGHVEAQTYCSVGASTPGTAGITQVIFNTINNSSSGNPAYTDYTAISTSVLQGSTQSLSVKIHATGFITNNTAVAWIDWNHNGTFDAAETYALGTLNGGLGSADGLTSGSPVTIPIPLTAIPGNTRMRIRTIQGSAPSACGNANNSEAEDYTVNVIALPVCSGTPNPGNTTVDNATPCPGGSVTLNFQNHSTDIGLSYQWQSSTTGVGGPFASNGLGTATSQVTTPSAATWYRLAMTCSGNTGYSTPVAVTPSALTTACYCAATATSDNATGVTNVTFNTISNTSTGNPAYSDYSAQSTTVEGGQTYALSVSVNAPSFFNTVYAKAWIDWNQNGTFDASESYDLGTLASVLSTVTGPSSGSPLNITVPLTAVGGPTIMRIRAGSGSSPVACGNMTNSEAEDYTVNVHVQVPCSGTPDPGNTTSSTNGPCPGANFTLGFQNTITESGITYQWQSSTAGPGGPFANNGLGTASTQVTSTTVPTWYHVVATCSGNPGTSIPVAVTPNTLAAACYCAATATTDDATGVTNVVFNTISNASTGNPAYSDLSAQSTYVDVGQTYALSVSINATGFLSTTYVNAWIDWNQNGTFDASELYGLGSLNSGLGGANGPSSGSPLNITVPLTAVGGPTIMRIRTGNGSSPSACGNMNNSEAEDYTVNVIPLHNTCGTAYTVTCGRSIVGRTVGVAHSMPVNACPFNGAPSTGGQNWYRFNAISDQEVTLSTCGAANFDTRISVFTGTDCSTLNCLGMVDDSPGCAGGTGQVIFNAATGNSYWIAVSGAGAQAGTYALTVNCGAICTPPVNDVCADAITVPNTLADGSGSSSQYTNACATVDAPTSLSGTLPVDGVWFSFNSGAYSHALITMEDNGEVAQYSATILNYSLFEGGCSGLGAINGTGGLIDAAGTSIRNVTPNTDYRMLVYNTGGSGISGSFGLLVEHLALDDAAITAILAPQPGLYCSSLVAPQITLLNNGDNNLTSVKITYGLSGGASHIYNWTGNLAYGASTTIILPPVTAEAGAGQSLSISTSLPNGAADGITTNDGQSETLDVAGEGVEVRIMTDANGDQLNWEIYDQGFNLLVGGGPYTGQNNTLIIGNYCLATTNGNCFQFILYDSFGDGLCCANGNGYWELRTPSGKVLLRDFFEAGVDGYSSPSQVPANPSYGFGHSFCLPPGPADIAPTECGIFNNALGNKVYCNKVTGAANYQFEFSNPDAGFFRRIARPYNYVLFGDMVTSPLVAGVKYFARVRTDRDGPMASAHFGSGCEMGLGVAQTVPCTQLIPAPSYGHSCNETRTFNTNNSFIYASPVNGATEYQFRIFIPGEGYDHTFIRSTYILQLKWNASVAPPLANGSTYNVEMNVKVNGTYSGFCPSACTITINNNPAAPEASMTQTAFGNATMWPNPVRDGQVNLNIDGIQDADQHITAAIFGVDGKQIYTRSFANSGDRFNTALELPNSINTGVYMVNITVNGKTTVQRLSIIK